MRALRTRTVVAVLAWKLAALALLPAALCCRAVLVADSSGTPACCEGGDHGAMCPLKRAAQSAAGAEEGQPRMLGCGSLEDALRGLLSLTGSFGHALRPREPRCVQGEFATQPAWAGKNVGERVLYCELFAGTGSIRANGL